MDWILWVGLMLTDLAIIAHFFITLKLLNELNKRIKKLEKP